jgi:hypothetical protein
MTERFAWSNVGQRYHEFFGGLLETAGPASQ